MRIAHVIHSMELGGAEMVIATLCRMQRRAGHAPSVHCLAQYGQLGERLIDEGFPVFLHGPAPAWRLSLRLYRHFRRYSADVVHCHNLGATIVTAPSARLAGVHTVISTRHGMTPPDCNVGRELRFWLAARLCRRVVAVSRTTHENLCKGPAAKPELVVTIYNCATLSEREAGPLPVKKEGFTIINVARHMPEKDIPTLLEAVAIACRLRPDLQLWLLGSGKLTGELQRKAASLGIGKHVIFIGECTDVGAWLRRADLFVMSSVSEGLPLSLLEAMEAGLPQVVTDVGGLGEVVAMSGGGVIVPPRDPEVLAARIVELANNPRRRAELQMRSRSCYRYRFVPERMAADYFDLYRECGANIGAGDPEPVQHL